MVQCLGWILSVGDFLKSRLYSKVFVVHLGGVNPDACLGNSNCVARVCRSIVTSQILPRFPFVSGLRNMAWLLCAYTNFRGTEKPVMPNVYPV